MNLHKSQNKTSSEDKGQELLIMAALKRDPEVISLETHQNNEYKKAVHNTFDEIDINEINLTQPIITGKFNIDIIERVQLIGQAIDCGAVIKENKLVFDLNGLALFKSKVTSLESRKVDLPTEIKSLLLTEANADCC